jgi:hypothetical protein
VYVCLRGSADTRGQTPAPPPSHDRHLPCVGKARPLIIKRFELTFAIKTFSFF